MDAVKIDDVLRLQDFGLERLDEDEAIVGFAKRAEARIARWLDYAKGALLMLMVPDDPESGCLYIYDRSREAFYSLALPIDGPSVSGCRASVPRWRRASGRTRWGCRSPSSTRRGASARYSNCLIGAPTGTGSIAGIRD